MAAISQHELSQFTGSQQYFRHWTGAFVYTEGLEYLCANGAAWLIDLIASHQINPALKKGDLRDFQVWELNVKDKKAVASCKADSNKKAVVTQEIPYTDFPLETIKVYVERGSLDGVNECLIAMLPSER